MKNYNAYVIQDEYGKIVGIYGSRKLAEESSLISTNTVSKHEIRREAEPPRINTATEATE